MIYGAEDIAYLCANYDMINPYLDYKVSQLSNGSKAISYGQSGAGYDIRIKSVYSTRLGPEPYRHVDPKDPESYVQSPLDVQVDETGRYVILRPHRDYKGVSVEYFRIPTHVMALCTGKSTYARVGVVPYITPLEPGWNGYLTLEFSNLCTEPVKFYLDEGFCQLLFLPTSARSQYEGYYQQQDEQRPYKATEIPNTKSAPDC